MVYRRCSPIFSTRRWAPAQQCDPGQRQSRLLRSWPVRTVQNRSNRANELLRHVPDAFLVQCRDAQGVFSQRHLPLDQRCASLLRIPRCRPGPCLSQGSGWQHPEVQRPASSISSQCRRKRCALPPESRRSPALSAAEIQDVIAFLNTLTYGYQPGNAYHP